MFAGRAAKRSPRLEQDATALHPQDRVESRPRRKLVEARRLHPAPRRRARQRPLPRGQRRRRWDERHRGDRTAPERESAGRSFQGRSLLPVLIRDARSLSNHAHLSECDQQGRLRKTANDQARRRLPVQQLMNGFYFFPR